VEAHSLVVGVTMVLEENGAIERLGRATNESSQVSVGAEPLIKLVIDGLLTGGIYIIIKSAIRESYGNPAITYLPRLVERHQRVDGVAHALGRVVYDDALLAET
jgi:hypothetical protein